MSFLLTKEGFPDVVTEADFFKSSHLSIERNQALTEIPIVFWVTKTSKEIEEKVLETVKKNKRRQELSGKTRSFLIQPIVSFAIQSDRLITATGIDYILDEVAEGLDRSINDIQVIPTPPIVEKILKPFLPPTSASYDIYALLPKDEIKYTMLIRLTTLRSSSSLDIDMYLKQFLEILSLELKQQFGVQVSTKHENYVGFFPKMEIKSGMKQIYAISITLEGPNITNKDIQFISFFEVRGDKLLQNTLPLDDYYVEGPILLDRLVLKEATLNSDLETKGIDRKLAVIDSEEKKKEKDISEKVINLQKKRLVAEEKITLLVKEMNESKRLIKDLQADLSSKRATFTATKTFLKDKITIYKETQNNIAQELKKSIPDQSKLNQYKILAQEAKEYVLSARENFEKSQAELYVIQSELMNAAKKLMEAEKKVKALTNIIQTTDKDLKETEDAKFMEKEKFEHQRHKIKTRKKIDEIVSKVEGSKDESSIEGKASVAIQKIVLEEQNLKANEKKIDDENDLLELEQVDLELDNKKLNIEEQAIDEYLAYAEHNKENYNMLLTTDQLSLEENINLQDSLKSEIANQKLLLALPATTEQEKNEINMSIEKDTEEVLKINEKIKDLVPKINAVKSLLESGTLEEKKFLANREKIQQKKAANEEKEIALQKEIQKQKEKKIQLEEQERQLVQKIILVENQVNTGATKEATKIPILEKKESKVERLDEKKLVRLPEKYEVDNSSKIEENRIALRMKIIEELKEEEKTNPNLYYEKIYGMDRAKEVIAVNAKKKEIHEKELQLQNAQKDIQESLEKSRLALENIKDTRADTEKNLLKNRTLLQEWEDYCQGINEKIAEIKQKILESTDEEDVKVLEEKKSEESEAGKECPVNLENARRNVQEEEETLQQVVTFEAQKGPENQANELRLKNLREEYEKLESTKQRVNEVLEKINEERKDAENRYLDEEVTRRLLSLSSEQTVEKPLRIPILEEGNARLIDDESVPSELNKEEMTKKMRLLQDEQEIKRNELKNQEIFQDLSEKLRVENENLEFIERDLKIETENVEKNNDFISLEKPKRDEIKKRIDTIDSKIAAADEKERILLELEKQTLGAELLDYERALSIAENNVNSAQKELDRLQPERQRTKLNIDRIEKDLKSLANKREEKKIEQRDLEKQLNEVKAKNVLAEEKKSEYGDLPSEDQVENGIPEAPPMDTSETPEPPPMNKTENTAVGVTSSKSSDAAKSQKPSGESQTSQPQSLLDAIRKGTTLKKADTASEQKNPKKDITKLTPEQIRALSEDELRSYDLNLLTQDQIDALPVFLRGAVMVQKKRKSQGYTDEESDDEEEGAENPKYEKSEWDEKEKSSLKRQGKRKELSVKKWNTPSKKILSVILDSRIRRKKIIFKINY